MFRSFSFWPWLIALIGSLAAAMRYFTDIGDPGPTDPDDWTPIPPLTPRIVEGYAAQGCSDREIADRFLVDETFIRREFAPVLRATRGLRAMRIRQAQSKLALDPNNTMLIWLGRNELGQANNPATPGVSEPEVHD